MIGIHLHENQAGPREKQLLALIRESAVPGALSYHYERPEGYEAFARTQGSGFRVIEAEENGTTLGFTQVTFDRVNWQGAEKAIAYSGDTRVGIASRGKRVSDHLIRSACGLDVPVWGAVMSSNGTVLKSKLAHWWKAGIDFKPVTELEACFYTPSSRSPPKPSRSTGELTCRSATASDLPAMFELWKSYSQTHNLTRSYADLDAFAEDFPRGTSIGSTLLVHDDMELIAMTGLWNQDPIRTIRVDSRALLLDLLLSSIPASWIRLPSAGEELKVLYSYRHAWAPRHPRCGNALRLLIEEARFHSGLLHRHFFCFGIDTQDPLARQARKGSLFRNRARIICDPRGDADLLPLNQILHLEVGMG